MEEIRDNPEASRIETIVDGRRAQISYRLAEGVITYHHTYVPAELEGRGIGSRLVKFALEMARQRGLKVVATCSFVRSYLKRHPEYQDVLKQ